MIAACGHLTLHLQHQPRPRQRRGNAIPLTQFARERLASPCPRHAPAPAADGSRSGRTIRSAHAGRRAPTAHRSCGAARWRGCRGRGCAPTWHHRPGVAPACLRPGSRRRRRAFRGAPGDGAGGAGCGRAFAMPLPAMMIAPLSMRLMAIESCAVWRETQVGQLEGSGLAAPDCACASSSNRSWWRS